MDPKSFKKLAKQLKLPAGGDFYGSTYSWHKSGGYAGRKVTSRVAEAAEELGWTQHGRNDHSSPDGSTMGGSDPYTSPEGYKLTVGSSYGVTKYENSFYIRLVLAPPPPREPDKWAKAAMARGETEGVIKLDKGQLRNLIQESMEHIPFGEASKYFDGMMTPEMNESPKKASGPGAGGGLVNTNNIAAMDEFVREVEDEWRDMYDDGDPTMAHLGRAAWERQVSTACDYLVDEIQVALGKIETKLTDGEFYDGKSEPETSEDDYLEPTGKRSDREDFHSDG